MLSELTAVFDLNDVVRILGILVLEVLKDLQLHSCLVLELFLAADDLDSNDLFGQMVKALEGLAKASFAEEVKHLEPIGYMIFKHDLVIPIFIIVAIVVILAWAATDFGSLQAEEVHFGVV